MERALCHFVRSYIRLGVEIGAHYDYLFNLLAGMNLVIVFGLKAVRISAEAYLYTGELTVDRTYI